MVFQRPPYGSCPPAKCGCDAKKLEEALWQSHAYLINTDLKKEEPHKREERERSEKMNHK